MIRRLLAFLGVCEVQEGGSIPNWFSYRIANQKIYIAFGLFPDIKHGLIFKLMIDKFNPSLSWFAVGKNSGEMFMGHVEWDQIFQINRKGYHS